MKEVFDGAAFFRKTFLHHRRQHLSLVVTAALTVAIVSGALVIGDSVRGSLGDLARGRLGRVKIMVESSDRWFRSENLPPEPEGEAPSSEGLIRLTGHASSEGGRSSAVSILGVTPRYARLGPAPRAKFPPLSRGEVLLNGETARRLSLKVGDTLFLDLMAPASLPGDSPLSRSEARRRSLRLRVKGLLGRSQFGDFGPGAEQRPPANVFLDREILAEEIDRPGRCNAILATSEALSLDDMTKHFDLADYGLRLRDLAGGLELSSERVFLDPAVEEAADGTGLAPEKIHCAFVNGIRHGDHELPYSFVAGVEGAPLPANMPPTAMVLNPFAAKRLAAEPGDALELRAFRLAPHGALVEERNSFTVTAIVPMEGRAADRSLMPSYPGMAGARSCEDWDPDLPIDLSRVTKDDEDYWKRHGGTPKAFVALATARRLWGNRYGELTALRFATTDREGLARRLLKGLHARRLGFRRLPLAREGRIGIDRGVNFAGLFVGLSFFLILAALLLWGLLLRFFVEGRSHELGLLRVLGFPEAMIWRRLFREGLVCAAMGAGPGLVAALLYARTVLALMNGAWQGAVQTSELSLHVNGQTLVLALLASMATVLLALWQALRVFRHLPPRVLLTGESRLPRPRPRRALLSGLAFLALAAASVTFAPRTGDVTGIAVFFLAGFACLAGTTQLAAAFLEGSARLLPRLSLPVLALRNAARRAARSRAVIRVLATALFLCLAVSVNRRGLLPNPDAPTSGTGGFGLYVETALPLRGDLNDSKRRLALKLDGLPEGVRLLALPSNEGTEASCLNLHRVLRPRLSGVDPQSLKGRFTFRKTLPGMAADWSLLESSFDDPRVLPVVADMDVILWSLGKGLGDELSYETARGETFRLRFVGGLEGSIFQGRVLLSMKNFYRLHPDVSGARLLLVNAPSGTREETERSLGRALRRYGCHMESTAERLASFHRVQNTYLAIFLALGGLALVFGCGGLAILLRRNVQERQEELRFLRHIGYGREVLARLLFREQFLLFALALLCGLSSSTLAMIPVLDSGSGVLPLREMALWLGLLLAAAVLSLKLAVRPLPSRRRKDGRPCASPI